MPQRLFARRALLLAATAAVAGLSLAASAQDKPAVPAPMTGATRPAGADNPDGRNRPHAGMLRYPDVSKDSVVFSYGNDLWVVPRTGGIARPLASPAGQEQFPKFSPDGSKIAFVGNYDGDRDIYVIDAFGGVPERVTYHADNELFNDWADDKTLLYASRGQGDLPVAMQTQQLFLQTVDGSGPTGGLPTQLPVPYGATAAISPDGKTLAYTPHSRDFRTWKRYRGGMATDVWLFDLDKKSAVQATDWEGTDTDPMLFDGKLYYLSDQAESHRLNLFEYDPATKGRRQITNFTDYDCKFPSIGPGPDGRGEIVFQQGAGLYLIGLAAGAEPKQVEVVVPGAKPFLRPRTVNAAAYMAGGDIGPTGKEVVVEARGDVWTLPAETGHPEQLTRTDGAAERNPAWSPDGRWVVFSSDADGEYNYYAVPSEGVRTGEAPQKLTDLKGSFLDEPRWSPDSKKFAFTDQTGKIRLATLTDDDGKLSAEVKDVDFDPTQQTSPLSWSNDSNWIAYSRGDAKEDVASLYLYDVKNAKATKVTSGMFGATAPAFDRKGDWLYYVSAMDFSGPQYSDADTSFVYENLDRLVAVPLRADVKNPMLKELDSEPVKKEKEEPASKPTTAASQASSKPATEPAVEDESQQAPSVAEQFDLASPIHGKWGGKLVGFKALGAPQDEIDFTMTLFAHKDGSFTGTSEAMGQSDEFDSITFDPASGQITTKDDDDGVMTALSGTLADGKLTGTWTATLPGGGKLADGTWSASKAGEIAPEELAKAAGVEPGQTASKGGKDKGGKKAGDEPIKIDLDGFEQRAILLPIPKGSLASLAVNDRGQLTYVRRDGAPSIKLVDMAGDEVSEGTVIAGVGGYSMSADGKKLLIAQGGGRGGGGVRYGVINASKGQSLSKPVPMDGMDKRITDVKAEWREIVTDAWRRERDYFYVKNMNGSDWPKVLGEYLPLVDDAASREDVSYIIGEMIAELNIGHSYYSGGEPSDREPSESVGMLGAQFKLGGEGDTKAYQIARVIDGGVYDLDARSPLAMQGVDVKAGDYLLAVNGRALDTKVSPYAAFVGLAGRPATLTVSDKPALDPDNEKQRDVVVTPMASESDLRYREWIAANAKYVSDKSDGKIGYIYVPNTGVDGQNDLFRQFYGQAHKDALIIDERWNGGGQIPTRFIELLNRPVTNYWARRYGRDWTWPPDGHAGYQAMLINGLAGSGGDMFPWLFKHDQLGPVIGTRTWGGLVGFSGVPTLIDGGRVTVPNFGFYETDGTWGIEGHGVDPTMQVIADPSKMQDGADPQIDAAVAELQKMMKAKPVTRPARPADPDRSGMGVREEDK